MCLLSVPQPQDLSYLKPRSSEDQVGAQKPNATEVDAEDNHQGSSRDLAFKTIHPECDRLPARGPFAEVRKSPTVVWRLGAHSPSGDTFPLCVSSFP
jgi:hypothetical protein